jgi:hypothetical protein
MQAQSEPATEVEVIPRSGAPVEESAAVLVEDSAAAAGPETSAEESAALLVEDSAAAGPEMPIEDSASAGQNAPVKYSVAAVLHEDCTAAVLDVPAEDSTARPDAAPTLAGSDNSEGNLQMHAVDNATVPVPLAAQDATTPAATTEQKSIPVPLAAQDATTPAATTEQKPIPVPLAAQDSTTPAATTEQKPIPVPLAAQDATTPAATTEQKSIPVPLAAQDATTPAATTEQKPIRRRFTRSLLRNILDEEGGTPRESQETPQHSKDTSIDSPLLPQRRFTRSQLKTKVESGLVGSKDVPDGASDSPPSVTKMEMKMSKKVALLTKHPGNIRELFNTGLLEETQVMYIIPHSKV